METGEAECFVRLTTPLANSKTTGHVAQIELVSCDQNTSHYKLATRPQIIMTSWRI